MLVDFVHTDHIGLSSGTCRLCLLGHILLVVANVIEIVVIAVVGIVAGGAVNATSNAGRGGARFRGAYWSS